MIRIVRGPGATVSRLMIVAAVLAVVAAVPASAQAGKLRGNWLTEAVAAYNYTPSAENLTKGEISIVGSTTWTGSLIGQTVFYADGKVDLVSGASTGTIDETFTGVGDKGDRGSLHFIERYTMAAGTGATHIIARVISAAGDFRGARGRIVFKGTDLPTGEGTGTYKGRLRP